MRRQRSQADLASPGGMQRSPAGLESPGSGSAGVLLVLSPAWTIPCHCHTVLCEPGEPAGNATLGFSNYPSHPEESMAPWLLLENPAPALGEVVDVKKSNSLTRDLKKTKEFALDVTCPSKYLPS